MILRLLILLTLTLPISAQVVNPSNGGVSKISAGSGIEISPASGIGNVTITSTGTPFTPTGTGFAHITSGVYDSAATNNGSALTNLNAGAIISGTVPIANLPLFTGSLAGIVSASGGGTSNFLRADNTWALPPTGFPITLGSTSIAANSSTTSISGLTLPSPTLTGTPTAPTAALGTNTTQIATTAFVLANSSSSSSNSTLYLWNASSTTPPTALSVVIIVKTITPATPITLPAGSSYTCSSGGTGCPTYTIKDGSGLASGSSPITITTSDSSTIDGLASAIIQSSRGSITLFFDGTVWNILEQLG